MSHIYEAGPQPQSRLRPRNEHVGHLQLQPHRKSIPSIMLAVLIVFGLSGCRDTSPIPPNSPGTIQNTPLALGAGLVASATPSPGPSQTPTAASTSVVAPPEPLALDAGFKISVFASLGKSVSAMALGPAGVVYVSVPDENEILRLHDANGNQVISEDEAKSFARGEPLDRPYGVAVGAAGLFVAANDAIWRYSIDDFGMPASEPERIADLKPGIGSWQRAVAVGPDGYVYASIGAECEDCQVDDQRFGTVIQVAPKGGPPKLFSLGLRSVLDIAVHPYTDDLWVGDRGRLGLGDDRPSDELNRLSAGGHFGWPGCFDDQQYDSRTRMGRDFCESTIAPRLGFHAHAGIAGLHFYNGHQFPESYRGDLYVALAGSDTRRSLPTGYNIVRVPFNDWAPRGETFNFVSGWLRPDTRRWGKPTDIIESSDGSLLITEPEGGLIYRVFYEDVSEETDEEG